MMHRSRLRRDTRKMLENWYLRNYTVLDTEADSRESAELTEYAESQHVLYQLPALGIEAYAVANYRVERHFDAYRHFRPGVGLACAITF